MRGVSLRLVYLRIAQPVGRLCFRSLDPRLTSRCAVVFLNGFGGRLTGNEVVTVKVRHLSAVTACCGGGSRYSWCRTRMSNIPPLQHAVSRSAFLPGCWRKPHAVSQTGSIVEIVRLNCFSRNSYHVSRSRTAAGLALGHLSNKEKDIISTATDCSLHSSNACARDRVVVNSPLKAQMGAHSRLRRLFSRG